VSTRLIRYALERVTDLDLNLIGRFARRELNRLLHGLSTPARTLGPRSGVGAGNLDASVPTGRCLRGLEVTWTSGWNVRVSAGAALFPLTSPVVETRPGTWSGRVETDDFAYATAVLPVTATTVAPGVVPGGALAQYEWWVVWARCAVVTQETDSQRKVFNEGTGVFDSASAAKVEQHKVDLGVARGSAGAALTFSGVPADGIPIAVLYVPAAATDHASTVIFDCRKLIDQAPGPNRVGGSWHAIFDGAAQSPYSETIFRGQAHARLGGELLSVRAFLSAGIQMGDLAEPSAVWDVGAALATPKIAWLYLTKVGGVVPRPVRRGVDNLGHHASYTNEQTLLDGALVLSPTPPRLGIADSTPRSKSGLRWDLRASATLNLPSFQRGDIPYHYAGLSAAAEDAICVGFYRYVGLTGGGLPILYGTLNVDEQGWMTGEAIASSHLNTSGLFSIPAGVNNNTSTPRTMTFDLVGFATATVGGVAHALPLAAARLQLDALLSADSEPLLLRYEEARSIRPFNTSGANGRVCEVLERRVSAPGEKYLAQFLFTVASNTFASCTLSLLGVRLPYGEDLVT
jgi:hypothetical protein